MRPSDRLSFSVSTVFQGEVPILLHLYLNDVKSVACFWIVYGWSATMQICNHKAMDWLLAEHFGNKSDCYAKSQTLIRSLNSPNVLNVKR